MLPPDVNILVYAYREDAPDHERFKDLLQELVNGDEAYGMPDLVCNGDYTRFPDLRWRGPFEQ